MSEMSTNSLALANPPRIEAISKIPELPHISDFSIKISHTREAKQI